MAAMRYLTLFALTSCAAAYVPNDYSRAPPADWPKLEQQVIVTKTPEELRQRCGTFSEARRYLACSELYFAASLCVIYVGPATAADVIEHERDHCRGYDHRGYSRGADAWERYKARSR